jgi:hypothetical protein
MIAIPDSVLNPQKSPQEHELSLNWWNPLISHISDNDQMFCKTCYNFPELMKAWHFPQILRFRMNVRWKPRTVSTSTVVFKQLISPPFVIMHIMQVTQCIGPVSKASHLTVNSVQLQGSTILGSSVVKFFPSFDWQHIYCIWMPNIVTTIVGFKLEKLLGCYSGYYCMKPLALNYQC